MKTAASQWTRLDGLRGSFMSKVELCCKLTLPRLWVDEGMDNQPALDSTSDHQSFGALALNHMSNRTMMVLFPPTRTFFRLDAADKLQALAEQLSIDPQQVQSALSEAETKGMRFMEKSGQRHKLNYAVQLLLATGNSLLVDEGNHLRVLSLRYYVVSFTRKGHLKELIIKENYLFDELDDEVQEVLGHKFKAESRVDFFKWVRRRSGGSYEETQWVGNNMLGDDFKSNWKSEEDLPYKPLAWNRPDNRDYGNGLVEDYLRDFIALSAISQSTTEGGVQSCESRILVNPAGVMKVDDWTTSVNGQALPGVESDAINVPLGNPSGVQIALNLEERRERRLSQAFMLNSNMVRDAERVTTYELRMMAQEMETQHGGSYSALATSFQPFVAQWCLRNAKIPPWIHGGNMTVATGLEALGRNGDIDNLRMAFQDLAETRQLPQNVLERIDFDKLIAFIGDGRQTQLSRMLLNKDQQDEQRTNNIAATAAEAGAVAQAEGQVQ